MRQYKKTMIFTSIVILIPLILGLILWSRLPDTMATHFGFDGEANGWSSKVTTVLGIPLFILIIHWICVFAVVNDPKNQKIGKKMLSLVLWICPLCSLICCLSMYSYALGWNINVTDYIMFLLGLIFVITGNYLPKCRQNYTVGIKLPWTLDDEENWNHTHRMAGKLWIIGGLVMIANGFLRINWIILPVIVLMVGIPAIYSAVYHIRRRA